MAQAQYQTGIERAVVWIVDLNNGEKSVTNDIEAVLAEIAPTIGPPLPFRVRKVVYRDTESRWDQVILTPEGTFDRFAPLNCVTREEAVSRVLSQ